MKLSIFIHEKEFHISNGKHSKKYCVENRRDMADKCMCFIEDFMDTENIAVLTEIIYPAGPSSFTVLRITAAIVRGLQIARPTIKVTAVSNFLTYYHSAGYCDDSVAIPTMRGDYFVADFINDKITNTYLNNQQNTNTQTGFANLAIKQLDVLNSSLQAANPDFICNFFYIDYGITPTYMR